MIKHDRIVIGASAGGVEALMQLAHLLPQNIPAAIFVVLHLPAYGVSLLPEILQRHGPLPAFHPSDGQKIGPGHIYIAPPDFHLVAQDDHIRLTRGPTENRVRPAVDTLFRSAARTWGPRTVGVVLSGMLDDGTAGAQAVKLCGGTVLVQDPNEATFAGMPRSAIEHVPVDYVLPIAEIASTLVRLANEPVKESAMASPPPDMNTEVEMALFAPDSMEGNHPGTPSAFSCPECHGVLWEIAEGQLTRYRCRVGHAYSPASLLAEQSESLEDALWAGLRALEEHAALAERLQQRAQERGHGISEGHFARQAQQATQRAAILRQALLRGEAAGDPAIPD